MKTISKCKRCWEDIPVGLNITDICLDCLVKRPKKWGNHEKTKKKMLKVEDYLQKK